MIHRRRLQAAVLGGMGLLAAGAGLAQDTADRDTTSDSKTERPVTLSSVRVTATRHPESALITPATVTVIDAATLHENMVTDFQEMFRYQPGIAIKQGRRSRGGESGIEVRGIGGQRLAMLVNGVRLPNGFIAAGENLGQLKLDPLSLKGAEVLRGPASSLYGSDALAGVVLFHTLSPGDFLDGGKPVAGSASVGFDGSDNARWAHGDLAFAGGVSQNLISVTARDGHEFKNYHDSALHPDPQHTRMRNVLLKSVLDLGDASTLTFIGEHYQQSYATNQWSLLGVVPGGTRLTGSRTHDDSQRDHAGVAWQYAPTGTWFDRLSAQVDYQRSSSTEHTWEARQPPGNAPGVLRNESLSYREPQWSASGQMDGSGNTGSLEHHWIVGLDAISKHEGVFNDARQTLADGSAGTNIVDGETYPRRIAPDPRVRNAGVLAEDEIAMADGRLRITPGLRLDYYQLSPHPDALFERVNVGHIHPVTVSHTAWTPRLGLTWEWRPGQVLYANYVTGFRMPTYDQLNRVGQVPVASFIHDFVPAPDLKPEKSRGVEFGLRGIGARGSYEVSAYYNRYRDFIDTQIIAFIPPGASGGPRGVRRLQARNVGKVDIYGVEATGQLALNDPASASGAWSLIGALQWSVGDDKVGHQPLNSIQPARLVAGLRWHNAGDRFGGQLSGNAVTAKHRVNTALARSGPTAPIPLTTGGYATVDVTGYVHMGPQASLNVGVYNVFDREYYDWRMVSGVTGNDPRLSSYSAPGRTVSATLRFTF